MKKCAERIRNLTKVTQSWFVIKPEFQLGILIPEYSCLICLLPCLIKKGIITRSPFTPTHSLVLPVPELYINEIRKYVVSCAWDSYTQHNVFEINLCYCMYSLFVPLCKYDLVLMSILIISRFCLLLMELL